MRGREHKLRPVDNGPSRRRNGLARQPVGRPPSVQPPAIGALTWFSSAFGSNRPWSRTWAPLTFFETAQPAALALRRIRSELLDRRARLGGVGRAPLYGLMPVAARDDEAGHGVPFCSSGAAGGSGEADCGSPRRLNPC